MMDIVTIFRLPLDMVELIVFQTQIKESEVLDPFIGITILLGAALIGGVIALRLKQPVILGYLVVGVVTGPHAFGLFSDQTLIESAATIGVALLMFTLGLELSLDHLKQVGKIGVWGGAAHIAFIALLGVLAGVVIMQWTLLQSVLFGLIIYNSSTAMCLKVLMDRGEIDAVHGRIAIAFAIVQDIAVVILILVLPVMQGTTGNMLPDVLLAIGKIVAFLIIAIIVGIWALPWLLGKIGGVGPRELFLLEVLVLAMGSAVVTYKIGLPSVFGAFLIGFILRHLRFSNQAIVEITPFRDVFVAIFFVSLGMLLDINYVVSEWQKIAILVPVILVIKLGVVTGVTWFFGYGKRVAIQTGVTLFEIGEFGFIIAQGGLSSGIISPQIYSTIIASAIITMLVMPSAMNLTSWIYSKVSHSPAGDPAIRPVNIQIEPSFNNPVIIAGYGRVGNNIARGLIHSNIAFTVIELDPERLSALKRLKIPHIYGDSSNALILGRAGLAQAKTIVVTYPDQLAITNTVINALSLNPRIEIIARVHREHDVQMLEELGVTELINPEYEASREFLKRTLTLAGKEKQEITETVNTVLKHDSFI
jgi:monovalent cation:H+ antiporter-2, CPA2 family